MPKPKGGRGHTAPYETKLARIPLPLADQVSELVERYQDFLVQGGEALSPPPLLDAIASAKAVNELSELEDLRKLVSYQEEELKGVHALNGDLNLQIQELQQQLIDKNAPKAVNKLLTSNSSNQVKPVSKKAPKAKKLSSASAAGLISIRENALHAGKVEPKLSAAVSDLVSSIDKVIAQPVNSLAPLNLNKLAKRLGYQSHPHLSRTKLRGDFTDLSRERDPDGIGWQYDVESKLFYPVQ